MAGIQIPTLKRIEPTEPASQGRIRADVPDLGRAVGQQSAAVEKLGGQVVDYVQDIEDQHADTEATKRANQFEVSYRTKLYGSPDGSQVGVKFQEGNPTEIYRKFDEEMIEEFERLTNDDTLSGKTKELTMKRLTDKNNQLELQKLTEYGYAQAKYEDGITISAIQLEKNGLSDAASMYKTDPEGAMALFDQGLGRIRDIRLRNGMKTGGVVPDENGNSIYIGDDGKPMRVKVSPVSDLALKRDLSEGVSGAIEDALISGNIELATELNAKYGNMVDSQSKKKLTNEFEKASIENQAYQIAGAGLNSKQSQDMLAKIKDPVTRDKVKDKALDLTNDREAKHEQRRERLSKQSYQTVMNSLQQGMESGAITTKTDLLESPLYKNLERHITDPRQRQALMDAVVQPKQTNVSSLGKVQDILNSGEAKDMSFEDFNEHLAGLNKTDRTRAMKRFENMKKPETGDQEARKYKRANDQFKDQALALDILKEDDFNRVSGKEFDKLVGYRNQLEDVIDALGPNPTQKEVNETVRNFALSIKKGEIFKPTDKKTFQGAGGTFGGVGRAVPPPAQRPMAETMKWMKLFYEKNGRAAARNTGELEQFIKRESIK